MQFFQSITSIMSNAKWIGARLPTFLTLFMLVVVTILFVQTLEWRSSMRIFPTLILIPLIGLLIAQLVLDLIQGSKGLNNPSAADIMDLPAPDVSSRDLLVRGGTLYAWIFGLMASIWIIGLLISVPLWIFLYLLVHGQQRWYTVATITATVLAFELGVLHGIVFLAWPDPIIETPQLFILERLPFP